MIVQVLHTISGGVIIVSLIIKVVIHFYLDHVHHRNMGIGSVLLMPLGYLRIYKVDVDEKYLWLKYVCNLLLKIAAVALFLNIIFGILIYFS